MPIIHVFYPKGMLDTNRKALLAEQLSAIMLAMEGGFGTRAGYGLATVLMTEVPSTDWWVGGLTDDTFVAAPGKLIARVSIPEGYMSQPHKSWVHYEVHAAVLATIADPDGEPQGGSIQVIIEEIKEGQWGANGQTISLADMADAVGLKKDGDRYRWVESYFSAKKALLEKAGFPRDVGGVLP
ncbi:4-oxalocrotonate tautomerase [Dyella sp. C9]|uniref:4-oxalocrotonate tautomerase n=1 Tax=Dyella sp. C9 TaxID=2202154 RepID=UPI000DEEFDDA|nr:4-oxalocrotonate tautomerase [Dyella sp. C9]